MPRYVTMPRGWSSATHDPESLPTCTIYEETDGPVKTGLLDASGTPLYRMPEMGRIGFHIYRDDRD